MNGCQNDASGGLWVAVRENREWRTNTSNQQPRCTQCRSTVAKWNTSTDSGGGGVAAVGGVWMGCSGVRMGCRQSGGRKDIKGGRKYYKVWNFLKKVKR